MVYIKNTVIGLIPVEWDVLKVVDFTLEHKQGFYTKESYVENGIPLVRVTDLYGDRLAYEDMPKLDVSEKDFESFKVNQGDFLFARSGSIGRYGIANMDRNAIFGSYLIRFVFNQEIVTNRFFGYLYESDITNRQLKAITQGSSNININADNIKSLSVPVPPLREQKKIAKILSTVDGHINEVDGMIEDLKELKKGLMQKLLTEGIGHTEFKDSEVGRIPVEWEVKKLGEIFPDLKAGSTPSRKVKEYYEGDIPWITSGELNYNVIYETFENITEDAVKNTNLRLYPIGTFFIAITGLEAAGTRGSCAINGVEATTNQSCMAFIPKETFSNLYLFYWYQLNGERLAFRHAQGTKQQSFNNKIVAEFELAIPQFAEQLRISSILEYTDNMITQRIKEVDELKILKRGLMQQLLTGKTRVKIDN